MATRTKDRPSIPYTPVDDTPAGTVVVVGTIVAVATNFIAAGTPGVLDPNFQGMFTKGAGAITAGAVVYVIAATQVITTSSSGNVLAGKAVEAAADAATSVHVMLTP